MFKFCDLGDEHLENVATGNIFRSLVIVIRMQRNIGTESLGIPANNLACAGCDLSSETGCSSPTFERKELTLEMLGRRCQMAAPDT
jgi:hypothetical protein